MFFFFGGGGFVLPVVILSYCFFGCHHTGLNLDTQLSSEPPRSYSSSLFFVLRQEKETPSVTVEVY